MTASVKEINNNKDNNNNNNNDNNNNKQLSIKDAAIKQKDAALALIHDDLLRDRGNQIQAIHCIASTTRCASVPAVNIMICRITCLEYNEVKGM